MTWNYRVTRQKKDGETVFEIREVYYNDQGEIESWTEDPIPPLGESVEELRGEIVSMLTTTYVLSVFDIDTKEEVHE